VRPANGRCDSPCRAAGQGGRRLAFPQVAGEGSEPSKLFAMDLQTAVCRTLTSHVPTQRPTSPRVRHRRSTKLPPGDVSRTSLPEPGFAARGLVVPGRPQCRRVSANGSDDACPWPRYGAKTSYSMERHPCLAGTSPIGGRAKRHPRPGWDWDQAHTGGQERVRRGTDWPGRGISRSQAQPPGPTGAGEHRRAARCRRL
jgi:hypothetical protein